MLHIDKNNFGTLYSISIDKLLQKDYCLIKTYPILSLTTKENHFLEENSTILLKNINKNLKIYIENKNNIIEISTAKEYEEFLDKYKSFNIMIKGDFSYFKI